MIGRVHVVPLREVILRYLSPGCEGDFYRALQETSAYAASKSFRDTVDALIVVYNAVQEG